jgi:ferredoxin-NADP reductase
VTPRGSRSPYLVDSAEPGDPVEVRGPIGGWFVWPPTEFEPDSAVHAVLPEPEGATPLREAPVQLIAGGSGVAPLMAMVRSRGRDAPPFRLLASVRDPQSRWYVEELGEAVRASSGLVVDWVYSRVAPAGSTRAAGRLTRDELERLVLPASEHPLVYVCGANSFVEAVAGWLVELGHASTRVRTERFGGL